MPADQSTIGAVVKAATDAGVDPAYALAVTERESSFNPNAKASKTIYGLQQMSGPERSKYGSGDSTDPYTQSRAWAGYMQDVNSEMAKTLGRAPTPQESYLGHYWGGTRAARIASGQIPPETPTSEVFTQRELAENPEIAKARSVGALKGQVMNDITQRMGKYANYGTGDSVPSSSSSMANPSGAPSIGGVASRPNPAPSAPSATPSLQNPVSLPEAGVSPEQPPSSIENNGQQAPSDVPRPLPPEQQAMQNQITGGSQQAQSQAPTIHTPRSVNSFDQLYKLYPQKITG